MPEWTPVYVEDRLRKAVALEARSTDGAIDRALGVERIGVMGGIRMAAAVDDDDAVVGAAAEALSWLSWLKSEDAELVLARLEGAPWKIICWRFEISRPTADRRWRYALGLIAWRLNGHAVSRATPSLRSILRHDAVRRAV